MSKLKAKNGGSMPPFFIDDIHLSMKSTLCRIPS